MMDLRIAAKSLGLYFQPWLQSAHQLLDFLVSREDATPFRHPVDLNDWPVSQKKKKKKTEKQDSLLVTVNCSL